MAALQYLCNLPDNKKRIRDAQLIMAVAFLRLDVEKLKQALAKMSHQNLLDLGLPVKEISSVDYVERYLHAVAARQSQFGLMVRHELQAEIDKLPEGDDRNNLLKMKDKIEEEFNDSQERLLAWEKATYEADTVKLNELNVAFEKNQAKLASLQSALEDEKAGYVTARHTYQGLLEANPDKQSAHSKVEKKKSSLEEIVKAVAASEFDITHSYQERHALALAVFGFNMAEVEVQSRSRQNSTENAAETDPLLENHSENNLSIKYKTLIDAAFINPHLNLDKNQLPQELLTAVLAPLANRAVREEGGERHGKDKLIEIARLIIDKIETPEQLSAMVKWMTSLDYKTGGLITRMASPKTVDHLFRESRHGHHNRTRTYAAVRNMLRDKAITLYDKQGVSWSHEASDVVFDQLNKQGHWAMSVSNNTLGFKNRFRLNLGDLMTGHRKPFHWSLHNSRKARGLLSILRDAVKLVPAVIVVGLQEIGQYLLGEVTREYKTILFDKREEGYDKLQWGTQTVRWMVDRVISGAGWFFMDLLLAANRITWEKIIGGLSSVNESLKGWAKNNRAWNAVRLLYVPMALVIGIVVSALFGALAWVPSVLYLAVIFIATPHLWIPGLIGAILHPTTRIARHVILMFFNPKRAADVIQRRVEVITDAVYNVLGAIPGKLWNAYYNLVTKKDALGVVGGIVFVFVPILSAVAKLIENPALITDFVRAAYVWGGEGLTGGIVSLLPALLAVVVYPIAKIARAVVWLPWGLVHYARLPSYISYIATAVIWALSIHGAAILVLYAVNAVVAGLYAITGASMFSSAIFSAPVATVSTFFATFDLFGVALTLGKYMTFGALGNVAPAAILSAIVVTLSFLNNLPKRWSEWRSGASTKVSAETITPVGSTANIRQSLTPSRLAEPKGQAAAANDSVQPLSVEFEDYEQLVGALKTLSTVTVNAAETQKLLAEKVLIIVGKKFVAAPESKAQQGQQLKAEVINEAIAQVNSAEGLGRYVGDKDSLIAKINQLRQGVAVDNTGGLERRPSGSFPEGQEPQPSSSDQDANLASRLFTSAVPAASGLTPVR